MSITAHKGASQKICIDIALLSAQFFKEQYPLALYVQVVIEAHRYTAVTIFLEFVAAFFVARRKL